MISRRPAVVVDWRWLERANDAFHETFETSGVPAKVMAAFLMEAGMWPEMAIESAVTKLNHAIAGRKGERLSTSQLAALIGQFRLLPWVQFLADTVGCDLVPKPDAQLDAELVQRFDARLRDVETGLADLKGIKKLIAARNEYDEREVRPGTTAMFSKGPLS